MAKSVPLPPQNVEAEESLLGSLLIDPRAILDVAPLIRPSDFYIQKHRFIYEAILALNDRGDPIDFVTLCDALEQRGQLANVGGAAFVTTLINRVPSAIHAPSYAQIVARTAIRRRMIDAASTVAKLAYNEAIEVEAAIDQVEATLLALRCDSQDRLRHISSYLQELYSEGKIEEPQSIPTDFPSLDQLLDGLQRSDLIVVGARTGIGKSSFMLTLARNAAKHGQNVGIFSLEMSGTQITQRLTAMESGIDVQRLRTGNLKDDDWSLIARTSDTLSQAGIWIDDTPAISISNIRAKARRLVAEHGLDLLVVDYLQLITNPGRHENRNLEIGVITRGLKALARELDIPVIVASQLSRRVEFRSDPRPLLSDLRESGSIEMDADVILFLCRESGAERSATPLTQLIVAKQRNGPTGEINVVWKPQTAQFEPLKRREGAQ
ncbi:MAG: replicative DNA helicase [Chloroflexi bacterium]|nr:replicative DNA helicase [Chloroflexota bacterium]